MNDRAVQCGISMTPVSERLAVTAIAMVSGCVLIYRAVTCGLLCDELLFVHAIDLGLSDSLMAAGSSHPPFLRLLVAAIADPSQAPDWLVRLPSLLFAIGSVFVWQRVLVRLIRDSKTRCFLLCAMALNPLWLEQGFQCLPYPALVFFSSLHCLAWMNFVEHSRTSQLRNLSTLIATGSVLPWIHFFGVNVLISTQFIWVVLLWKRQTNVRTFVFTNLIVGVLTVPVVPVAVFYLVHDKLYPLIQISDFSTYFVRFSSYCFSRVTMPGLETTQPFFLLLYFGMAAYLWRFLRTGTDAEPQSHVSVSHSLFAVVAFAFVVSGFTAIQAHSFIGRSGMWPRYMLCGSWLHLPVIALLMNQLGQKQLATGFVLLCATTTVFQAAQEAEMPGAHYSRVAQHLETGQQRGDTFLVQSMDMWSDENHFDQLWLERYTDSKLKKVTAPPQSRTGLQRDGLQLQMLPNEVRRVWVFSHLYKSDWLQQQSIDGWQLADIKKFGGPFPVARFDRTAEVALHQSEVAKPTQR